MDAKIGLIGESVILDQVLGFGSRFSSCKQLK